MYMNGPCEHKDSLAFLQSPHEMLLAIFFYLSKEAEVWQSTTPLNGGKAI